MFSLGILLWPLTTAELKMAQFGWNLEENLTERKRPTMAIRLDFLSENFFVKLFSQVSGLDLVFPYKSLYSLTLVLNPALTSFNEGK